MIYIVIIIMASVYVAAYYLAVAFLHRRSPAPGPTGHAPGQGDLDAAERRLALRLLRGTIDPATYRRGQATLAALDVARDQSPRLSTR
jgi:hypothetical protein